MEVDGDRLAGWPDLCLPVLLYQLLVIHQREAGFVHLANPAAIARAQLLLCQDHIGSFFTSLSTVRRQCLTIMYMVVPRESAELTYRHATLCNANN
eukprot:scaffold140416_cov35-Prasinocladus_malaysianus.AAC.1